MNSRVFRLVSVLLACAGPAFADTVASTDGTPAAYPLSAYADLGSVFAENRKLGSLGWTDAQFEAFVLGMTDSFHGKPHVPNSNAQALVAEIGRRLQQLDEKEAHAVQDYFKDPAHLESYMKEVCKGYHLERADSGLAYGIRPGSTGTRPEPGDSVVITCSARAPDGKTELPQLALSQKQCKIAELMPGLAEGVQMMTKDSSAILVLPPDLSFGTGVWPPGVNRGTPIIFMLTLEQIIPGT